MNQVPDDDQVLERLLSGRARPEDVDGPYGAVDTLLRAAARDDERIVGDEVSVSQLMAALEGAPVGVLHGRRRKVGVALAVAAVVGMGATGAAAANGSLPDPIQDVVHDLADAVGFDIPDGEAPGRSAEAPGRPDETGTPDEPGRSDEAPGQGTAGDAGRGIGPDGVPPGQGGTIPGNANGNGGITGGDGGGGVGPDGVPPGQGGTSPGNANGVGSDGDPPQQIPGEEAPGEEAPGEDDGNEGTAGVGNGVGDENGVESGGVPPGQGGTFPANGTGNGGTPGNGDDAPPE